jgi:hypothetical protein
MPILVIQSTLSHSLEHRIDPMLLFSKSASFPANRRSASAKDRLRFCSTMRQRAGSLRIITAKSRRPTDEAQQKSRERRTPLPASLRENPLLFRRFVGRRLGARRRIGRIGGSDPVGGVGIGRAGRGTRHVGAGRIGARIVGRCRASPDHVTGNGNGEEQKRPDQNAQNGASGCSLSGSIVGNLLSHL